jgi:hypothetical protein
VSGFLYLWGSGDAPDRAWHPSWVSGFSCLWGSGDAGELDCACVRVLRVAMLWRGWWGGVVVDLCGVVLEGPGPPGSAGQPRAPQLDTAREALASVRACRGVSLAGVMASRLGIHSGCSFVPRGSRSLAHQTGG